MIYECPFCDRTFDNGRSLGSHKRWHPESETYKSFMNSYLKIKECEFCGKEYNNAGVLKRHEFWCDPNNKEKQDQARKTRSEISKGKYMGDKNPFWKGGKINVNCGYCNKDLEVFPGKYNKNKNFFCNKKCNAKWMKSNPNEGNFKKRDIKKEKHPNWKGGKIKSKCDYCNKEIEIKQCYEIKEHHFCSTNCFHKWHKENIKGENHWNWNSNREEVYVPYSELFYDEKFRDKIKEFQCYRDLLNGDTLRDIAQLHHLNWDKSDDSHFIKGDVYCNLCFLNPKNHGKMQIKKRKQYYIKLLIKNTIILKNNKIPNSWEKQNKIVCNQEKLTQTKLLEF